MTLEELQNIYYKHNVFWPGGKELTQDDVGVFLDVKKVLLDIFNRIEKLE